MSDEAVREAARVLGSRTSPAKAAASRRNGLTSGKRAGKKRPITPEELTWAYLAKIDKDLPGMIERLVADEAEGRLDETTAILIRSMAELEVVRRKAIEKAAKKPIVKDHLFTSEGKVYGHRLKAHPLLEVAQRFQRMILETAEALQATKKSRGEGDRDKAFAALAARRAMLIEANRGRLRLPPPAPRPAFPDAIPAELVR